MKPWIAAVVCALSLIAGGAAAQEYPTKPVRVIVPYEAGGLSDLVARLLGDKLSTYWGQQVLIDNRPGAGGTVGLHTMIREADEGYTVLMGTSSEVTINPVFEPDDYSEKDAVTVAIVTTTPMVLVANADAPFDDWQGFVEAAKAASEPLAFSSAGNGTITHITGEAVALAAGVKLLHIAYKGGAPATMAAVSGEVPLNLATVSTALQHIKAGTVKAIAVTSAERSPDLPDVPTVAELASPGFDYSIFVHLTVPADTSADVIAKWDEGIKQALSEPDVQEKLKQMANTPVALSGPDAMARVTTDREKARKVVEQAQIKRE